MADPRPQHRTPVADDAIATTQTADSLGGRRFVWGETIRQAGESLEHASVRVRDAAARAAAHLRGRHLFVLDIGAVALAASCALSLTHDHWGRVGRRQGMHPAGRAADRRPNRRQRGVRAVQPALALCEPARLANGKTGPAMNALRAFINEVQAQTGKAIKPEAAAMLIVDAELLLIE